MKQVIRGLAACALVGFLQSGCSTAGQTVVKSSEPAPTVNPEFRVDAALAHQGEAIYTNNGCYMCHRIGDGRAAGPDLFGVTERRTIEWMTNFLKDTEGMLASDDIAKGLFNEFKQQRMPNFKLSEQQATAVIHYLQEATNRKRSSATP